MLTFFSLVLPLQAWRCSQARALLLKLRVELPKLRAQHAWHKAVGLVQAAQRRQRLQAVRRELAVLTLQSAVRGWLVRREVEKQLAGVRRFQVICAGRLCCTVTSAQRGDVVPGRT
jgi:hypothetical protein